MPLDLVLEDGEKKEVKMEDTSNNEDSDDCTQHNGTSPKVSVTDFQTSSKVVGFNFFYVNAKKCVLCILQVFVDMYVYSTIHQNQCTS